MHTIVVGCGRLGAEVARSLVADGESVAVIDKDPRAFRRLGDFPGTIVVGLGFDLDALQAAGIERADALGAVTGGDNSNIVVARMAREQFGVSHVVARIKDAARAEIFHRLGIPTVASVGWTTDQVVRRLHPARAAQEWTDPSGDIQLIELSAPDTWAGRRLETIEELTTVRAFAIGRGGRSELAAADTVVQGGDLVYVGVVRDGLAAFDALLTPQPVSGGAS